VKLRLSWMLFSQHVGSILSAGSARIFESLFPDTLCAIPAKWAPNCSRLLLSLTVWHIVLVSKQRQQLACVKISILSSWQFTPCLRGRKHAAQATHSFIAPKPSASERVCTYAHADSIAHPGMFATPPLSPAYRKPYGLLRANWRLNGIIPPCPYP
jgi:hypothetical protein